MRVFYHVKSNGLPISRCVFNAYTGFDIMGFELIPFVSWESLQGVNREDIILSGIGTVEKHMKSLGIKLPDLDYPDELQSYLGRKTWTSTINTIANDRSQWPVFVKSIEDKRITGKVIRSTGDLIGCGAWHEDIPVRCSEVIDLRSEFRVFVKYGRILDVRPYNGSWKVHYDSAVIKKAIADYETMPAGCGIDFGVTRSGDTVLIEVNDGYALGDYGLMDVLYAKLLSARWSELTGTKDECDF